MALENLSTVFNGISQNEIPSTPLAPIAAQTTPMLLNDLVKIDYIQHRQLPSPIVDPEFLGGIPNIIINPITDDEVSIRRKDLSFTFGDKIRLGKGKLIFDTLYNKNHTTNENRVTFKVGQQTTNTSS
jgi:hypothetical protein